MAGIELPKYLGEIATEKPSQENPSEDVAPSKKEE